MSDSESDVEMQSTLTKTKIKATPGSPQEHLKKEPKKMTTSNMIHAALEELKTRKGVSLHAIKKYMIENYSVDTEKINFLIKKTIKKGLEKGTIIQTKGMGVSGSFKLAPPKKEQKKLKKVEKKPKAEKNMEKPDKPKKKEKTEVKKKEIEKSTTMKKKVVRDDKSAKAEVKSKKEKTQLAKDPKKEVKIKTAKQSKKETKTKMGKKPKMEEIKTPAKNKTLVLKRKSIGSIIKPPKMKPK